MLNWHKCPLGEISSLTHFPRFWPFVAEIHWWISPPPPPSDPLWRKSKSTGEFPPPPPPPPHTHTHKVPGTQSFTAFVYVHLNKQLRKQRGCGWFDTPSRTCGVNEIQYLYCTFHWDMLSLRQIFQELETHLPQQNMDGSYVLERHISKDQVYSVNMIWFFPK